MENNWALFKNSLAHEIGEPLAVQFVESLIRKSEGNILRAERLYYEVGRLWAPLLVHWRNWIVARARHPPVLIMRDAKPLTSLPISKEWSAAWLNRENCGIPDEIAGSVSRRDSLLEEYLRGHRLMEPFTFVDTGCWGSIVKEFHEVLGLRFQPLFFFSHNPHIPGFLNECGVPEGIGELLNDSLECCFPNTVTRPHAFQKSNDVIVPCTSVMDPVSVTLGCAVMRGVENAFLTEETIPVIIERLVRLSEKAQRGAWTGILPHHSPTWSRGASFLADWPPRLSWK